MIDGYLLNMRVSDGVGDGRGRALKPLEEAAEVFGAWQRCDGMRHAATAAREASREDLIDGCMDTVQAIADLLAAVGATQGEADAAIRRMDERNGDRGGPCAGGRAADTRGTAAPLGKCEPKGAGHD